jgi:hypothetical protein
LKAPVGFDRAEREAHEAFVRRGLDIPAIERFVQVIFGFVQGAGRNSQKPCEFTRCETAEALGDVGWRRSRAVAKLLAESAIPAHVRPSENCTGFLLDFHRELPNDEIFEATHDHTARRRHISRQANPVNRRTL